jgi:S1-C subfamily serine protease
LGLVLRARFLKIRFAHGGVHDLRQTIGDRESRSAWRSSAMRETLRAFAVIGCCAALLGASAKAEEICNEPFERVYSDVAPAVTRIFALTIDPFNLAERVQAAIGAGVVMDDDGHIITNAHVVYGASTIIVRLSAEDVRPGKLIGADPVSDIAVVQVAGGPDRLPQARFGDSDHIQVGEDVLAIGHPFGLTGSATRGIISGIGRLIPRSPLSWQTPFIQTDAALNPGNSGGPLANRCGEVIGINTLSAPRGNVGFAVPINLARDLASQILENGRVIRPWYGIYGRMLDPELRFILGMESGAPFEQGLLVETVEPGSPAERIGLKGGVLPVTVGTEDYLIGGDIITKVDDQELKDMDTVVEIVSSLKVGDTVSLEYYRSGRKLLAQVTLPERPILPGDTRWIERADPDR